MLTAARMPCQPPVSSLRGHVCCAEDSSDNDDDDSSEDDAPLVKRKPAAKPPAKKPAPSMLPTKALPIPIRLAWNEAYE